MKWREEWNALAIRIESLLKATNLISSFFITHSEDPKGIVEKSLSPNLKTIISELKRYNDAYSNDLPTLAATALNDFLATNWENRITNSYKDYHLVVPLGVFSSEFNYLIHDAEQESRNLIDLAFEHLKRLIVVDEKTREIWLKAFNDNEMACEKLGSVHLLSHGIWAFKITGAGAATDLVFNDPIEKSSDLVKRTARTLVLTEWKRVKKPSELLKKMEEARAQADIYKSGVLGDIELKQTRYIILVTNEDICPSPSDILSNSITYRHIIIPVEPKTPSKVSRSGKLKTIIS